jgi:hypothetical protein
MQINLQNMVQIHNLKCILTYVQTVSIPQTNIKKQLYPETPPLRHSIQCYDTALEAQAVEAISTQVCWTRCFIFEVLQKLADVTVKHMTYCFKLLCSYWSYDIVEMTVQLNTGQIWTHWISCQPAESCFLSVALLFNGWHHVFLKICLYFTGSEQSCVLGSVL